MTQYVSCQSSGEEWVVFEVSSIRVCVPSHGAPQQFRILLSPKKKEQTFQMQYFAVRWP
jgi:hypothetical protein